MIEASPCSALTVNPSCFAIAGISLEQKKRECDALLDRSNWEEAARRSTTRWDSFLIAADTTLGIAGLSLHFMIRDFKFHHSRMGQIKGAAFVRAESSRPRETMTDTSRGQADTLH